MSKRRLSRLHSDSEDQWSGEDGKSKSSSSDTVDLEWTQEKRKGSQRKNMATRKKQKLEAQVQRMAQSDTRILGNTDSMHLESRHSIGLPGPMRTALLRWFTTVRDSRGMPWRKPSNLSQDPQQRSQRAYEVWVSEIMLQQTQVATVIPYYNRWMEAFPTLKDLAQANVDQVNALWKGLGYYSRARRLLEGAKKTVEDYGGSLPNNAKEMQKIPGIGRYSAGAICSIAYGERVPVLDGNVHRLLSRLLALHAPPKAKATLDLLWEAADVLVQEDTENHHPGDINQGLIELGSTICTVRNPSCDTCPLQPWCAAYELVGSKINESLPDIEDICRICEPLSAELEVTAFPMKADRKKAREELDIVNVIEWRQDKDSEERLFLLVRRPETGLLAGLYDFPSSPNACKNSTPETIKLATLKLLGTMFGRVMREPVTSLSPDKGQRRSTREAEVIDMSIIGDVAHVFSHVRKTYRVVWILVTGGDRPPEFRINGAGKLPGKLVHRSTKQVKNEDQMESDLRTEGTWTSVDQVANATIGTGTMKVWNLAKAFWGKNADIY